MDLQATELRLGAMVGTVEYEVAADDVREYRDVMGMEPSEDVPPDFVPKRCMEDLWGEVLLAIGNNVRAKQAFDFFAPVRIGQTVHGRGYVAEVYERRGRRFVVLEALYADDAGDLIVRDRRTQILLGN